MATLAVSGLIGLLGAQQAEAKTTYQTITGTLASDDSVALYTITLAGPSNLSVSTDSYGGGVNYNGTTTMAGGFVPIISLFSPTGVFITDDGADIHPPGQIDPVTGVADDAAFSQTDLAAGNYTLAVTEFFNFPNGNLSNGFFEAGQGNFTGPTCGRPGGSFLQTNLVSCPQRTDAFTVNVAATAVPEPSVFSLMILGFGALGASWRVRKGKRGPDRRKLGDRDLQAQSNSGAHALRSRCSWLA